MKNILKYCGLGLLSFMIIVGPMTSCATFDSLMNGGAVAVSDPKLQDVIVADTLALDPGIVPVDISLVDPQNPPEAILWPIQSLPVDLQDGVKKIFGEATTSVIFTTEYHVKPETLKKIKLYVPPAYGDPNSPDWFAAALNTVKDIAPALPLPPGVGPVLSYIALLMLGKRSRQHLANSAKAVVPTDGRVDIKEAMLSFAKAAGLVHTNQTPEELRAVADRLEAKLRAEQELEAVRSSMDVTI